MFTNDEILEAYDDTYAANRDRDGAPRFSDEKMIDLTHAALAADDPSLTRAHVAAVVAAAQDEAEARESGDWEDSLAARMMR